MKPRTLPLPISKNRENGKIRKHGNNRKTGTKWENG